MQKTFALLATLLLSISLGMAQKKETIDVKGDMYYDAGCYPRALTEYMRCYQRQPENTALLKRITQTILAYEMPRDTAVFFIEKYLKLIEEDDVEALYLAAQAHFHAHNFSRATKYLKDYQTMVTDEKKLQNADRLSQWITNAQRMMRDTLNCRLVNLGDMINTVNSEINPIIADDDKLLIFSSDEKYNSMAMINVFNIKFSENQELSWTKSKGVTGAINTAYDEYVTAFANNKMFFNSNRDVQFAIYESDYKGTGRFGDGVKFSYPFDLKGDEVAATCSPTGDTIIFSATQPNGKLDLYFSIYANGKWGQVRPVLGQINTEDYDENYPIFAANGRRLYFASDRPTTMGGYDIYYSDLKRDGTWGEPVQMKYPINDTYDNLTISYSKSGRYAYISSIRHDSFGSRDIYAVVFDNILPTMALMKCFVGIKAKPKPIPLSEQPLIRVYDENNELVSSNRTNISTSVFILALDPGTYRMEISAAGAQDYSEVIRIEEKTYDQNDPIEKMFILEPEL